MYFDAHSDLLYDVTRRRLAGEDHVLEKYHLDRLRRGGVEGMVLALWTGTGQGQTFWRNTPEFADDAARTAVMMDCARAELSQCQPVALVHTVREAMQDFFSCIFDSRFVIKPFSQFVRENNIRISGNGVQFILSFICNLI